jgi:copper chaperone NosL
MMRTLLWTVLAAAAACAQGPPPPAPLDAKAESCRFCRMPISDPTLAAQIVAPGEEPKFFDDLGCLRDFLRQNPVRPGSAVYVTDHRTRGWLPAASAVYTRASIETPMGSHWIAHADAASRDADPAARGGVAVERAEIFGPGGPPDGR